MEKRAIIAFGLSAVLLFAYVWVQEHYFTPPPAPKAVDTRRSESPASTKPAPSAPEPPVKAVPAPPSPKATVPATSRPPQRTATVDTPLYHAVVSSEGGKLQEWTLHYRGEKPMVIVGELGAGGLGVTRVDAGGGEPVPMSVTPDVVRLDEKAKSGALLLEGKTDGLDVRQEMGFTASTYLVRVVVSVRNTGSTARPVVVTLPWSTRQHWADGPPKFIGQHPSELVWSTHGRITRAENLATVPDAEFDGEWIGVDSVWYLAALIPKSGGFKLVTHNEHGVETKNDKKDSNGRVIVAARATPTIAPGETWDGELLMFIGPKEYERLKAIGLEETLNFGGFPLPRRWGGLPMEWLGVPILLLMKWVYSYVGNYGIAIILLTVVSKVLFYPLTVRSMRSMKAMQALQPQVNALRTKYKSDPQRAQREMMDLYRQHKVNPMGGCLPMVAQIPIFYALYLALSVSVELQNAAFICFHWLDPVARMLQWFGAHWVHSLWVCNLADPDPIYVLPVLMGVSMFLQQKMTPTTADPRQAKMMLVMPFVFTIMFVNLASGLVLYWTVSNVLQILQQWLMERPRRKAAREA
jgi:YidC/Oxa1 family membrane protein insertase